MMLPHAARKESKAPVHRALYLLCLIFFLLPPRLAAVDPHTPLAQHGHTAWRSQDGFISGATSITQTTDGYMWIAAGWKIYRFDGVRFSQWTPPHDQSLANASVVRVHGTSDGSLWIVSRIQQGCRIPRPGPEVKL
jgi:hypothetical protein